MRCTHGNVSRRWLIRAEHRSIRLCIWVEIRDDARDGFEGFVSSYWGRRRCRGRWWDDVAVAAVATRPPGSNCLFRPAAWIASVRTFDGNCLKESFMWWLYHLWRLTIVIDCEDWLKIDCTMVYYLSARWFDTNIITNFNSRIRSFVLLCDVLLMS